jgi:NADH:ubiquinone oxidoreductase subunit 5 (subunit L)/multisubunit Na+/H+ antiporter MnhA subunit
MALGINAIFLIIAFIVLSISSGFVTNAAIRVAGLPDYGINNFLKSAHRYFTIAAVVGWLTVFFLLVATGLAIFFAPEEAEASAVTDASPSHYIVDILLVLTLLATGVVGILAAIGANEIHKSGVVDNKLSYRNSIIAAVLAIVVAVFIIAALIFTLTYKPKKKVLPIDKEIGDLQIELGENPPNLKEE